VTPPATGADRDRSGATPAPASATPSPLLALGLRAGDTVRFRRTPTGRWIEGTVVGREKDGSVSVRDRRGAARAIVAERLQVRSEGPRGGTVWLPVTERATGCEQLDLL
jgi:hypothetical protein